MKTKRFVLLGFLMAIGIVLQLLESFVPIVVVVPGFKIGLANIVSLFALMVYGNKEMWIVGIGRIFIASLLQGTLFSIPFWLSLTGGLFAMFAMGVAQKISIFSIYGISILGSSFHVLGQVIAITYIYSQYFMQIFLPILLALSIVSGLFIALLTNKLIHLMKGRI